jgi:hypothetical protein
LAQRDAHCARVVEAEVLAKGRKALLITGGVHLDRGPLPDGDPNAGLMMQIIERRHPGETFVVQPHEGFGEHNAVWEARLRAWPRPSVALVANTWLALPPGPAQDVFQPLRGGKPRPPTRPQANALLYLGPCDELTMEQTPADVFRDSAYVEELDRRSRRICKGRALDRAELTRPRPKKWVQNFPDGDVFLQDR